MKHTCMYYRMVDALKDTFYDSAREKCRAEHMNYYWDKVTALLQSYR